MNRACIVALLALNLLQGACTPTPAPRTVGEHVVLLAIPAGWTAYDEGRQLALRQGEHGIVLRDLGTCGPPGWRNEVARARALFRSGQAAAARQRLGALAVPASAFPTPDAAATFRALADELTGPPDALPADRMESGHAEMLLLLADAAAPDFDATVTTALPQVGYDARREDIQSRTPIRVGGIEGQDVATWNRLSHASPRRYVFACNDGYLLALVNDAHPDAAIDAAFATVLTTLRFVPRRDA
jgi:hypothetical protein